MSATDGSKISFAPPQRPKSVKSVFTMDHDNSWGKETEEELIIRIAKGGFEKEFGITFEKFQHKYKEMIENNPEKLI